MSGPVPARRQEQLFVTDLRLGSTTLSVSTMAEPSSAGGRMGPRTVASTRDHRVDVYALGYVSYQCLTGQVRCPTDDARELIHAPLTSAPPRP